MNDVIYLDNNATTQLDSDVARAMHECQLTGHANPASQHRAGQRARSVLENARDRIASILNIDNSSPASDRLVFTSGGTEANNLALRGLCRDIECKSRFILVSSIEHPSVLATANQLKSNDHVEFVHCNRNGLVDLDHLRYLLTNAAVAPTIVSIMAANNETGVVQPVAEIVDICRELQPTSLIHTDAVQLVGKIPVDFQELKVDAMSFSAHKFHGPSGIGGLAIRKGVQLEPLLFGGSQQLKLRPGTEPIAPAVGMGVALQKWSSNATERANRMLTLRNRFEERLRRELDDITINGQSSERLPHTSNVSFLGVERQPLLMALDFAGVYCSTGSACESGSSEPSHVLIAMGLSEAEISSALRFSLSVDSTADEIDEAVRRISMSVRGLRKRKRRPKSDF